MRSAGPAVRARGGVDLGDLERFVAVERREDRRQPAGEHRLADAGRADHQQVVRARGRDRERAAARREPAHVGEVEGFVALGRERDLGRGIGRVGPRRLALQARVQLAERARDAHARARDERGFRRVARRAR